MIEKTDKHIRKPNRHINSLLGFCVLKIHKTISLILVNGVATIENID